MTDKFNFATAMSKKEKYKDDPIGYALMDYMEGERDKRITVFSHLTEVEYLPVSYLMRSFEEMPGIEQKALDECRGKVLDIGAGSGTHTLELQKRGFTVDAIDISRGAVETMKLRGIQNAWVKDFFTLNNASYDTLLMLMNGVGIAGDTGGLEKLLSHAKTLIRPNGQILLDSSDITYMYLEDDNSLRVELGEEYYGVVHYRMDYKGLSGPEFKWLFVDFDTLWHKARKAGMDCEMLAEESSFHYLAKLTITRA